MHCIHLLTCPFCQQSLTQEGQVLVCANRHSFDMAKEGYVNLLRKKLPGDTKEMLRARRAFLERGFYQKLAEALTDLVATRLQQKAGPVLDAGCGEGYYLGWLQQQIWKHKGIEPPCYLGLDISKDAVQMAAKRYKDVDFVVANLKERLVCTDQSIQVLLNIFAPRNPEEFARILLPSGWLLIVIPAPTHLLQLRETFQLLGIEEQKREHVIEQFRGHFTLEEQIDLEYNMSLHAEEIELAVMMTPNYWHMEEKRRQDVKQSAALDTQVAFTCLLFQKKMSVL